MLRGLREELRVSQKRSGIIIVTTWLGLLSGLGACLGDVEIPPEAPTLFAIETPTRRPVQNLSGQKPTGCAVLINGEERVAADAAVEWTVAVDLQVGDNVFVLQSQRPSGLTSVRKTRALIVYEPNFPTQPSIANLQSPTREPRQSLEGSKPSGSSLWLGPVAEDGSMGPGQQWLEATDSRTWNASLQLDDVDGVYCFWLTARDVRGQDSEPVDFCVTLDRQAPEIQTRSPQIDELEVVAASWISVAFNEAMQLSASPPAQTLRLRDATDQTISGVLNYQVSSHALVFVPNSTLNSQQTYTVQLDPGLLKDLAGNSSDATTGTWQWSFTCGDQIAATVPNAPSVVLPDAVVSAGHAETATILLTGQKDPNTSLWINDEAVVALSASSQWQAAWPLEVGDNSLQVVARARDGQSSPATALQIERVQLRPPTPVLDPVPPSSTDLDFVVLEGTRAANTAIVLNEEIVVPRSAETQWVYRADLVPGRNLLLLQARDAQGVLSEPLELQVDYAAQYEGPVPSDFHLVISLDLRNLVAVQPISSSLGGGGAHYAVDAWLEGPLELGEMCRFDTAAKERQNINYVATLVHYVGRKVGRTNPFWDADYRAPDYLAALVTGGVFADQGILPSADRRNDSTGHRGGDLVDGSGRVKLTTSDLSSIDGVTEATVLPGTKYIDWYPVRFDGQRLQQGEYLLQVVINLDRDPGWAAANDYETCWENDSDFRRGAHRISARLRLSDGAFQMDIPGEQEAAGTDPETGADQLRYLGPAGMSVRWMQQ